MTNEIRVLLAEDVEDDATLMLRHLRKSGFELQCTRVQTGEDLRDALMTQHWDVILCDYKMPRFSAPDALRLVQDTGLDIPFIVVSGTVGEDVAVECLRSGAADFVSKDNLARLAPAITRELADAATRRARRRAEESLRRSEENARRIVAASKDAMVVVDGEGFVRFANPSARQMLGESETLQGMSLDLTLSVGGDSELEIPTTDDSRLVVETSISQVDWGGEPHYLVVLHDVTMRKQAELRLRESYLNLADTLSRSMASRDPYTTNHQRRVAELVTLVGAKMGLDEECLWNLRLGGLLHDIGKIAVPESILARPGTLAPEELDLVRTHAQEGYDILHNAGLPEIVPLMTLHHHERLDGTGYPQGLTRENLSLEDRVLTVCNAAEAMGSFRPYRRAASMEQVIAEVHRQRGKAYDSDIADKLIEVLQSGEFVLGR